MAHSGRTEYYCISVTDPMIIFSDTTQSKPMTEKVDILMSKIGLADHKPVPEPVKFSENDPLGTGLLKSATSSGDVLLTLCKSEFLLMLGICLCLLIFTCHL